MRRHRAVRIAAVVAASLAIVGSALAGASASPLSGSPSLSQDRRVGPPTSRLAVHLAGFRAGETVVLSFDGSDVARVVADAQGAFAGLAGGALLAYCAYFVGIGPSYQQWKFASYSALPLSFVGQVAEFDGPYAP